MLKKVYRLRKRTEFAYSFKHGKTAFGELTNMCIFVRRDKLLRIGFSVSKKIGKAVIRNKIKRQLRAIVESFIDEICRGYNLIIVAKQGIENKTYNEIVCALKNQFKAKGLLCK